MTFDLEIRGFLPNDRCLTTPADSSAEASFVCASRFTGVGIPEGSFKGLLKIPSERGEKGPGFVALGEGTAGLFVIILRALGFPSTFFGGPLVPWSSVAFCPAVEFRAILANELAVGANSLEDLEDSLDDEEPTAEVLEDAVPTIFDPRLPILPVGFFTDRRVPMEDMPVELVLDTPVPASEFVRDVPA